MRSSPVNDERRQPDEDGASERQAPSSAAGSDDRGTVREPEARDAAQLAVDLEHLRGSYLRARADLVNYRKRAQQDVERQVAERHERLLRDWLEVVDSVDRALAIDRGDGVQEGLRAVLEQMQAVLARQGAQRVEPEGERFDPDLHEAVATHTSDEVPDRTVLQVARAGYRLGDRVLRPAQVVVSQARPEGAK